MTEIVDLGTYPTRHFKPSWNRGEEAWLRWNGFPHVPRYMDGWSATVLRCSRNSPYIIPLYRVRIPQLGEERTVRADQLEMPH